MTMLKCTPGQFWHISDLHLDYTYHITDDHTKVCSSSKGSNASNPGFYGDFMCDSPYQLILSAFQYIKDSHQQADFMIWTGDSPPHVPVNELSTKMVIDVIGNMTSTIRNLLPDLLVFPALGNHDYWPQDQFPVAGSEIYTAVAEFWKPWLTEEALITLREGGYYSQIYPSNATAHPLRIISLNTNLYYSPNKVTINMTDPANQFEWLEDTLKNSRQNHEKVYIIAHVPIGYLPFARLTPAMREYFNERLVKIFRKYCDVIAGQFYGHTHRDSIMVLLDEKDNPVGSVFVAPAVTPIKSLSEMDSNNPGFRLYQYDTNDYKLLVSCSCSSSIGSSGTHATGQSFTSFHGESTSEKRRPVLLLWISWAHPAALSLEAVKRQRPVRYEGISLGTISSVPYSAQVLPKRLLLPVLLKYASTQTPALAFLDSGSGGNFINQAFAVQHKIPLRKKAFPVGLEAIDGRPLQPAFISLETLPIELSMKDGHLELIFFMSSIPLRFKSSWVYHGCNYTIPSLIGLPSFPYNGDPPRWNPLLRPLRYWPCWRPVPRRAPPYQMFIRTSWMSSVRPNPKSFPLIALSTARLT
ncbi:cyclic GMP-AMP phosphodiesterase SMPDL3A isoform X2 [Ascaphus truei]|uniref:cyclic GMP-AMP phosphodiesterase SMPDL3A isoform X2 n=1 Tax=Ascaphus truei TaxID=8439 RepID=UPI003F5ABC57